MADSRTCISCGAQAKTLDARFCEFCGTELPLPETPSTGAVGPHGDLPARFAAFRRHGDLPELMEREPSSSFATQQAGCSFAVMIPFVIVAGVLTVAFANLAGAMALIPAGMLVFGLVMLIKQMKYAGDVSAAPLERAPVLVVGKRSKLTGGENATTRYFVTIQDEQGQRRELKAPEEVVGHVGQGDLGLAYVKHDLLVEFARVDV